MSGMTALLMLLLAALPALTIVAALHDLATMKIPNWISAALIVAFFPAALATGLPAADIGLHLAVAVAALFAGMAMFALRWVGGGDAKLIAASALWFGPSGIVPFLLAVGLLGGFFCLTLILARRYAPAAYAGPAPTWFTRLMEPKGDIPYGVAIAAGALAAFPDSPLVALFIGG